MAKYLDNTGLAYFWGKVKPTIPTSASDVGAVDTTSIVTSVSSSSTDSQVPSAKCMYTMLGDIESILEELL